MFIKRIPTFTFIKLKAIYYICLFFNVLQASLFSQIALKGKIFEEDSTTLMPFVFIINKSNGNGTVSDLEGRFAINSSLNDTLMVSFVGFAKKVIPVKDLKPLPNGEIRLYMNRMPVNLNMVTVTGFKIKPYEREYMKDIITRGNMSTINKFNSPITALYMQYSKEGKQVRKLSEIFENLLIEEQVQRKLNPEILRRLTGDDNIDYNHFRRYCFQLTNEYILSHEGFDLYTKVMDCYRRYKYEGH